MRIVEPAQVSATLWRNGGGLTRPLAEGHAGHAAAAHLDEIAWRISLADITADGPFSVFPGMDRHAVLLGSGGVALSGPSGQTWAWPLAPVSFPGEAQLDAQRQAGTRDARFFNLMVRRAVARGELRVSGQALAIDSLLAWAVMPLAGQWDVAGATVQAGQVAIGIGEACRARPLDGAAQAVLALVISTSDSDQIQLRG